MMFNTPIKRLKRHIYDKTAKPCVGGTRKHFPGEWNRRELKESPITGSKLGISPVKLCSKKQCTFKKKNRFQKDEYILFYRYHFIYAEELFYGHIALMVIMAEGDGNFLTKSLQANRDRTLEITHFKFIKELGSGAFGTVFLSMHPTRNKLVAVKKVLATSMSTSDVKQSLRTMIEKEASCHIRGSPHIIQLLDTFTVSMGPRKAFYFVYEYADGGDLNNLIYKLFHKRREQTNCFMFMFAEFKKSLDKNPLVLPMTKYLGAQILLGVLALHERGIIHMDLKPENILITKMGIIKIADLGMVKRYRWFHYSARAEFLKDIHSTAPIEPNKDELYLGGSMAFMEPELRGYYFEESTFSGPPKLKFDYHITFSADYFAVGLILFKLLTGFVYGQFGTFNSKLMYITRSVLKKHNSMILIAWYAYKSYLKKIVKELFLRIRPDRLGRITEGLDEGIVSILQSTVQPRKNRWTEFTIPVKIKRQNKKYEERLISIEIIKEKIPLFENLDFDGIAINGVPDLLVEFINSNPPPIVSVDPGLGKHFSDDTTKDLYVWPYFDYHLPKDQAHIPQEMIEIDDDNAMDGLWNESCDDDQTNDDYTNDISEMDNENIDSYFRDKYSKFHKDFGDQSSKSCQGCQLLDHEYLKDLDEIKRK